MGVRWFSLAEASSDSPYLRFVVFIPLDELRGKREAFTDGDLEGRDTVVITDEVGGDASFIKVKILVLASFHGSLQTVLGVVNASVHSCAVSLPGKFAEFDGGDEAGDDLLEAFGGDFVMGGQGGEDSVWRHGSVVVEDNG